MKKTFLLFLLLFLTMISYGQYQLKRIAFLTPGNRWGHNLVCGDTDHDSLNELIFSNDESGTFSLQVWEYRPTNRYELVWFAVGGQPPPPGGILVGNFAPNDIGDIDRDGLPDLVGPNQEWVYLGDTAYYYIVTTQESPDSSSLPETLSWYYRYSSNLGGDGSSPFYFTELDSDSKNEIIVATPNPEVSTGIWENVANNQNELVWHREVGSWAFTFGDFDMDGWREFVTANLASLGLTSVYENVAPDSYELVFVDTVRRPNGSDVFSGNDLDGDGKPEFFVSFAQYVGSTAADIYLYMWETIGNNSYERTLLDVVRRNNFTFAGRWSRCGDLDGDGIEELVWSTQTHISVYKATGNNEFQRLWEWRDDHASDIDVAHVNIYDMNNNGYNEIIFSGSGKHSIFEIEAVRLLNPNGGQNFLPGDSVLIQWQKFIPPRCDSFSLSYTMNNGITYLPIAFSISASESTYNWIVPNTPSESCLVKVTAYGPGTQFDESDALFTIIGPGIDEIASLSLAMTSINILPNPFESQTTIRLTLPTAQKISLKLYDISGKLTKVLCEEKKNAGIYRISLDSKGLASGIYFLSFQTTSPKQLIERLIIVK